MKYFIYSISHEDKTLGTYIGSTEDFKTRFLLHKSCSKCGSHQHLYTIINSNGGFDNWKMEIIEEVETDNKADVYKREQYWIDQTETKLNKRNATFSINDYMRGWYKKNREIVLGKKKGYYQDNKDKRLEYQRAYYLKKKSNLNINDSKITEVAC